MGIQKVIIKIVIFWFKKRKKMTSTNKRRNEQTNKTIQIGSGEEEKWVDSSITEKGVRPLGWRFIVASRKVTEAVRHSVWWNATPPFRLRYRRIETPRDQLKKNKKIRLNWKPNHRPETTTPTTRLNVSHLFATSKNVANFFSSRERERPTLFLSFVCWLPPVPYSRTVSVKLIISRQFLFFFFSFFLCVFLSPARSCGEPPDIANGRHEGDCHAFGCRVILIITDCHCQEIADNPIAIIRKGYNIDAMYTTISFLFFFYPSRWRIIVRPVSIWSDGPIVIVKPTAHGHRPNSPSASVSFCHSSCQLYTKLKSIVQHSYPNPQYVSLFVQSPLHFMGHNPSEILERNWLFTIRSSWFNFLNDCCIRCYQSK